MFARVFLLLHSMQASALQAMGDHDWGAVARLAGELVKAEAKQKEAISNNSIQEQDQHKARANLQQMEASVGILKGMVNARLGNTGSIEPSSSIATPLRYGSLYNTKDSTNLRGADS